jgi:uncharacterized protein
MGEYKRIERDIVHYIAGKYKNVAEVGVGSNFTAAEIIAQSGILVRCSDIRVTAPPAGVFFFRDDIFDPDVSMYAGADLVYAIRAPGELIPPLIALCRRIDCDLLVYHLGFETYMDGGEIIDCGVILHLYHRHGAGP